MGEEFGGSRNASPRSRRRTDSREKREIHNKVEGRGGSGKRRVVARKETEEKDKIIRVKGAKLVSSYKKSGEGRDGFSTTLYQKRNFPRSGKEKKTGQCGRMREGSSLSFDDQSQTSLSGFSKKALSRQEWSEKIGGERTDSKELFERNDREGNQLEKES